MIVPKIIVGGILAVLLVAGIFGRPASFPLPDVLKRETTTALDTSQSANQAAVLALVIEVLDGDTVDVLIGETRERVRYIGIDAPEMNYKSPPAECLAAEALARNVSLVAGQWVELSSAQENRDRYGRLLRYVSVRGEDVGATLLAEGYGRTLAVPPNLDRALQYDEIEAKAKADRRGVWGESCDK